MVYYLLRRLRFINFKSLENVAQLNSIFAIMESTSTNIWTFWQKKLLQFVFVFVLLFMATIPFHHKYIPDIGSWLSPLFETLVGWSGRYIFQINAPFSSQILSDSTGMYLHVFNLLCLAIIGMLLSHWFIKKEVNPQKIYHWLVVIASYYLAIKLFSYGFSKIFKWQFYLPEPNILFTRVGDTPRDLLYWTVMGTSRGYSIFLGVAEILAATLLLFRRTRLVGGLIAFGILINIVAINFCFDISVKVFSSFLLLLSALIISKDGRRLFDFLFLKKTTSLTTWSPIHFYQSRIYGALKIGLIWWILFDALARFFVTQNFNDDLAIRPLFHGAYEVEQMVQNQDTLLPFQIESARWQHVFIHRNGYFITQNSQQQMQDFGLEYDLEGQRFLLQNSKKENVGALNFIATDDLGLSLSGNIRQDTVEVFLKKIDWEGMKLLEDEFHWRVDD